MNGRVASASCAAGVLLLGHAATAVAQVDAGDYLTWQRNYGVDCNRDRKIDAADYNIWRANYGTAAAANTKDTEQRLWKGADLNCDGAVDAADYVVWRKTTGG
jgi:hypothetical protein